MLGIALFWMVPDMTQTIGLAATVGSSTLSLAFLVLVDRYWMPICPCCTRGDHPTCSASSVPLTPLLIAILVHNAFDGWTASIAGTVADRFQAGIVGGLLAHKVPEAIVFGMMLHTAAKNKKRALFAAMTTSVGVILGAWGQTLVAGQFASIVISASLALACASFLFVGSHLFWKQQREKGISSALLSSAAGVLLTVLAQSMLS